jgi:hypothetical protein
MRAGINGPIADVVQQAGPPQRGILVVRSPQRHPCGRVNQPVKQGLVYKIRRHDPSDFIHQDIWNAIPMMCRKSILASIV